jgi:uncharacterized protein
MHCSDSLPEDGRDSGYAVTAERDLGIAWKAGYVVEEWQVLHNQAARRFVVTLGDEQAVLNYRLQGDGLVITHTGVPPAWRGRGIAAALTQAALEYARHEGLSVAPACSYAAAYMRRHPEYGEPGSMG